MSVDRHVYVGPFIEATHREARELVAARGCQNVVCSEHPKDAEHSVRAPYCHACGGTIGEVKVWRHVREDVHDLVGETLRYGVTDGCMASPTFTLIPNVMRAGAPIREDHFGDYTRNAVVPVTPDDVENECEWLTLAFHDEITKLRAVFDGVRVRWGICKWHS